jgi:hypothetical protein
VVSLGWRDDTRGGAFALSLLYSKAFSSLQIEDWKNFLRMKID